MDSELAEKDLPLIQNKLWKARVKWYNIGLDLKLSPDDLDVIDKDKDDTDSKFRTMIFRWLRSGGSCTWEDLYRTLSVCSVGYSQLADTLQEERCPDSSGHAGWS